MGELLASEALGALLDWDEVLGYVWEQIRWLLARPTVTVFPLHLILAAAKSIRIHWILTLRDAVMALTVVGQLGDVRLETFDHVTSTDMLGDALLVCRACAPWHSELRGLVLQGLLLQAEVQQAQVLFLTGTLARQLLLHLDQLFEVHILVERYPIVGRGVAPALLVGELGAAILLR